MRSVKDPKDIQIVVNDLLNWRNLKSTKDWDFHGLRIKNASPATDPNDYVILAQLPKLEAVKTTTDQFYAIEWTNAGVVTESDVLVPYIVKRGRVSLPIEVSVYATNAAEDEDFKINFSLNGNNILIEDLTLPIGENGPLVISNFVDPVPTLGYKGVILPVIVQSDGIVSGVEIGISCRRVLDNA